MTAEAKEAARLAALHRYNILDTPPEKEYDDLVRLAALICEAPIAGISLVDRDRLWFKAKYGVDACQMARENSFCAYALESETTMIVPDASADPRFANHPVVSGPAHFRFYAGACLKAPGGEKIGTLWVVDHEARQMTAEQQEALEALTRQTMAQLELRRTLSRVWTEMDLAKKIQTVLLPQDGRYGPCEIAATMLPATDVGGDYYDMFEADGRVWVLVGDVSGHGVTAGLVMMMAQTAVRTAVQALAKDTPSPARILAEVNAILYANLRTLGCREYMTISALCIEDGRVAYSGLHDDFLIYRAATDTVETIPTTGVWLGIEKEVGPKLEDRTMELGPDDVLVLQTDGLTEARTPDNKLLGFEPVIARLREVARGGGSVRQIVDGVLELLSTVRTKDDVTLVALRRAKAG